jgi:hypothetical protein
VPKHTAEFFDGLASPAIHTGRPSPPSVIIASTEGNVSIPEKDEIKIGLNVYKKV